MSGIMDLTERDHFQWSSLLYGDSLHKSHMQSIIDKLQTPQSFLQSVQELVIALQRTGGTQHRIIPNYSSSIVHAFKICLYLL